MDTTKDTRSMTVQTNGRATPDTLLPELRALYNSMEERKTGMLARLEAIPPGERGKSRAKGEWSPRQVMEHLVVVEEWIGGTGDLPPKGTKVLLKGKGHLFITFGGT